MRLHKPSANPQTEKYSTEYLILKDELNFPISKKEKLLSIFRPEIDPVHFCAAQIEKIATREFNIESGPVFWKPFVMYTIHKHLASGERLSFEEIMINVEKDPTSKFMYSSDTLKAKMSLLGGLLVLTEQNLLQRTRENDRWVYSLVSIRDSIPNIEKLSDAFMGLRRGEKLERKILC